MKRLLGLGALAPALGLGLLFAMPGLAFADEFDDLCAGDPNCTVEGGDPFGSSDSFGPSDQSIVGIFVAFAIVAVVIAVGTAVYRVSTARELARKAGLDEDAAGRMALLDENGLTATYVASALRAQPAPPAPGTPPAGAAEPVDPAPAAPGAPVRPAAERLAELQTLLDTGAITEAEHAARRRAIIDSI